MDIKENKEIRPIQRDIRFFVFGLFILYLIGCAILSLTLGFFKEWGLIERSENGIYFSVDAVNADLIEFYNAFNAPRRVYLQMLKGNLFITVLFSLVLFAAFMRLTSSRKNKGARADNQDESNQDLIPLPFGIDFVILDLPGSTKEGVFLSIAEFVERKSLIKDSRRLKESFLERERLGSSAIGSGIALPEACFVDMPKEYVLILCRLKEKIDFDSIDSLPVSILLVFLCREKNKISRLKPVMRLIDILRPESYQKRFLEVTDEQEACRLLQEADASAPRY